MPDDLTPQEAVARVLTYLTKYATTAEREPVKDEAAFIEHHFNNTTGQYMPLMAYAFAGDASAAMQRWIAEEMSRGRDVPAPGLPCRGAPCGVCYAPAHVGCPLVSARKINQEA